MNWNRLLGVSHRFLVRKGPGLAKRRIHDATDAFSIPPFQTGPSPSARDVNLIFCHYCIEIELEDAPSRVFIGCVGETGSACVTAPRVPMRKRAMRVKIEMGNPGSRFLSELGGLRKRFRSHVERLNDAAKPLDQMTSHVERREGEEWVLNGWLPNSTSCFNHLGFCLTFAHVCSQLQGPYITFSGREIRNLPEMIR